MWKITLTRKFAKDLAKVPQPIQKRIEGIITGEPIRADPFLNGRTVKLSEYQHFYRIRVGDYRIGLRIDGDAKQIKLLRVLHRREIYRRFP